MEIDVAFFHDNVEEDPCAMPNWPGGADNPIAVDGEPHRCTYTHGFLSKHGFSLGRSDTIAELKDILIKVSPILTPELAIGRRLEKIYFGNIQLKDTDTLVSYDPAALNRGTNVSNKEVYLSVFTSIEVTVHLLNDSIATVSFPELDMKTVKVVDIKKKVQEKTGIAVSAQNIVRRYPTLRDVVCDNEHLLFGYEGVFERGIWKDSPHKGPIYPADLPTPPDMQLCLVDDETFQRLQSEDEWWHQFETQKEWTGFAESLCGERYPMKISIQPPLRPGWMRLEQAGGDSINIHALSKKTVKVKLPTGQQIVAAEPDKTSLQGPCTVITPFKQGDLPGGEHYLPTPLEISEEGKSYHRVNPNMSFGKAVVSWQPATGKDAWEIQQGSYVLNFGETKTMMKFVVKGMSLGDDCEMILEAELAKGISQCRFIRGDIFYRYHLKDLQDTFQQPFCVFQSTPDGSVPSVVDSPMGIRYSGLKERGYTMFNENKEPLIGYRSSFVPWAVFVEDLPNTPRQLIAELTVQLSNGTGKAIFAWISWKCDIQNAAAFGIPSSHISRLQSLYPLQVNATTSADIETAVDAAFSGAKIVGVGNRTLETAAKPWEKIHVTVQQDVDHDDQELSSMASMTAGSAGARRKSSLDVPRMESLARRTPSPVHSATHAPNQELLQKAMAVSQPRGKGALAARAAAQREKKQREKEAREAGENKSSRRNKKDKKSSPDTKTGNRKGSDTSVASSSSSPSSDTSTVKSERENTNKRKRKKSSCAIM